MSNKTVGLVELVIILKPRILTHAQKILLQEALVAVFCPIAQRLQAEFPKTAHWCPHFWNSAKNELYTQHLLRQIY